MRAQRGAEAKAEAEEEDLASWVNAFIGTDSTGNTFPGATLPFGMVQLSPMMTRKAWDYNSGYHRGAGTTASPVFGFSLTALSGTGLNDAGDFIFLPTTESSRVPPPDASSKGGREKIPTGSVAELLHDGEKASPGSYSCTLRRHQGAGFLPPEPSGGLMRVELTARLRCGMLRIRFGGEDGPKPRALILNFRSPQDKLHGMGVTRKAPSLLSATRSSVKTHHCSTDHVAYAAIEANTPIKAFTEVGKGVYRLDLEEGIEELLVRVGLSHVDEDGALRNLRAELNTWDFDAVAADARREWNAALGRASIDGSPDVMIRYYSALYHAFLGPTLFSDVDRRYRLGGEGKIVRGDFDFYSSFSLWDTYRAEHPLLNLLFPNLAQHFAKSLLAIKDGGLGRLPRWVLYGKETDCMIGYPAAVMLSEAALKGLLQLESVDGVTHALEIEVLRAAIDTAKQSEGSYNVDTLSPVGDRVYAGMSKGLEYAWADSCISKLAGRLGQHEQQEHFLKRSRVYRLNFHSGTKMLLPRRCSLNGMCGGPDEGFVSLLPNRADGLTGQYYVEGTPLQYTFMVPHDVPGLIELFGSKAALQSKLEEYFEQSTFVDASGGRDLETGHLGGHVQGNEPGHHIPYLYNAADAPWKAQETLDKLLAMYTVDSAGLPGNDDVGQMSAWFVLSSLGLYPVDPCDGQYSIGRPLVRRARLQLARGNLTVVVHDQSLINKYVQRMTWNGELLVETDLDHASLIKGGELVFWLGSAPTDFRVPAARTTVAEPLETEAMVDTVVKGALDDVSGAAAGQVGVQTSVKAHGPEEAVATGALTGTEEPSAEGIGSGVWLLAPLALLLIAALCICSRFPPPRKSQ